MFYIKLLLDWFLSSQTECVMRHPPGKEIYRKLSLSLFEVDGSVAKV